MHAVRVRLGIDPEEFWPSREVHGRVTLLDRNPDGVVAISKLRVWEFVFPLSGDPRPQKMEGQSAGKGD